VLVLFPMLIFLGAKAEASGVAARTMVVAGAVSYATYTLHAPLITWATTALWRIAPAVAHPDYSIAAICTPVVLIGALLADRYFDGPVRNLLSRLLLRARK
jgi:peptidoglycan/LPS O-acetylase OafA/YrhL